MKRHIFTLLILACFATSAAAQTPAPAPMTAIRAGRLIDPETGRESRNQVILVEGRKIKAVGENVQIPAGARVIDLSGSTVMPGLFDAHIGMSRALESLGRPNEAEAAIQRAIGIRPDDWRGHNRLGIHFFDRGEYASAASAWLRVTQLAPDQARGWFNLAGAFYRLDRLEEAVQHYERSIEIKPTALAYGSLGTVLFFLKRFEEAVMALRRATEINPLEAIRWGNLGNAYRWLPGHEEDSSRALDRAIELGRDQLSRNPDDVKLRARLAGWLASRGYRMEAQEAVESALRSAPGTSRPLARRRRSSPPCRSIR